MHTLELITPLGTLCALLSIQFGGGWGMIGEGLIAVAALLVVGNILVARSGKKRPPGLTTESAGIRLAGHRPEAARMASRIRSRPYLLLTGNRPSIESP